MEARAQARYVRVTPMKARRVVDLIRGMDASDAQAMLRFAPQAASEPVGKVLASAVANAANNHGMDARELTISEAFVDEGPTMKRIRPRAQGRAYRVRKRSCHITLVVSDGVEAPKFTKPTVNKQAAAKKTDTQKAEAKSGADDTSAAKDKAPAKKTAAKKTAAKKAAPAKADAETSADAQQPTDVTEKE